MNEDLIHLVITNLSTKRAIDQAPKGRYMQSYR